MFVLLLWFIDKWWGLLYKVFSCQNCFNFQNFVHYIKEMPLFKTKMFHMLQHHCWWCLCKICDGCIFKMLFAEPFMKEAPGIHFTKQFKSSGSKSCENIYHFCRKHNDQATISYVSKQLSCHDMQCCNLIWSIQNWSIEDFSQDYIYKFLYC